MSNEHLEHNIMQLLLFSEPVSAQLIDVQVRGRVVTLRGELPSFKQKLAAQIIAESDPNVERVNNLIVVKSSKQGNDQELVRQIHCEFASSAELSSQCINVNSNGGNVTLVGYIGSPLEKNLASDIAAGTTGINGVTNLTMINRQAVLDNQEHCHAIGLALKRIIGMEKDDLVLSVVDETAQVTGVVDQLWKKEVAETTVRKFKILNVANDIVVSPP